MTSLRGNQKFPKSVRVRSRLDFAAVYDRGLRIGDGCMALIALANDDSRTRLASRFRNVVAIRCDAIG